MSHTDKSARQVVTSFPQQEIAAPDADIDERNGWTDEPDRGNPLSRFEENPFDRNERVSLCADELGLLFQWLLFGGSTRNRSRSAPVNQRLKDICKKREMKKILRRPSIIGHRLVAMLLRLRPDLLDGHSAASVSRKMRISPRMMALHTMSFGENFPLASKTIRRTSKVVKEEVLRARHRAT